MKTSSPHPGQQMTAHAPALTEDRIGFIRRSLKDDPAAVARMRSLADDVTAAFREADEQIEHYTRIVCPHCTAVCCINRHSAYDYSDILYLWASGAELPPLRDDICAAEPCQHLGERGCRIRRPRRPYRCTWYFCAPLLEHIRSGPAGGYRGFIRMLENLTLARGSLKEEFETAVRRKGIDPESLRQASGQAPLHSPRGCRAG